MPRGKTVYIDINESSDEVGKLQINILTFIDKWVKTNKTPVPKKEIIIAMEIIGSKEFQVDHALRLLLRRQYIRRAVSVSNKTEYVQLRRI